MRHPEGCTIDEIPKRLDRSAVAAAGSLGENREFFEARGVSPRLIDLGIGKLEGESDEGLNARLKALPAGERLKASRRLMHKIVKRNTAKIVLDIHFSQPGLPGGHPFCELGDYLIEQGLFLVNIS